MRKLRCIAGCLAAGASILLLGYWAYVEAGGPPQEAVARQRMCFACHAASSMREPLACLRSWRSGQALSPLLGSRLRSVHPLLSRGAEEELTALLVHWQLSALEQQRAGAPGEALYIAKCAACHGRDGMGQPGEYPPLLGSEWLTAEPSRLQEILTRGLQEPITVKGVAWDKKMRAPGLESPKQVEQIIGYLRKTFAR